MSQNPWPYVVVMLGSLGFLANSMAQQNNRFSNPAAFNGPSSQERDNRGWGTGNDQEPTLRVTQGTRDNRNQGGRNTLGLDEPEFGTDAGDIGQPFDDVVGQSGRRGATFRRDSDPEVAQIPIEPRTNTPAVRRDPIPRRQPVSPAVGEGRGTFPTQQRRGGVQFRPASPHRRTSVPIETENEARFNGNPNQTKETSLFDRNRAPGSLEPRIGGTSNSTKPEALLYPFRANKSLNSSNTAQKPTLASGIQSVFGGGKTETESTNPRVADASGYTPAWFKWALFFSIGANLFFGYIAMSMHSRYQDLIEDMHASDSRLERQRPRRRAPERDEEPAMSSRQRRRDDETAFLQGGIEV